MALSKEKEASSIPDFLDDTLLTKYGLGSGIDITRKSSFFHNHSIVRKVSIKKNIESRIFNRDLEKEEIVFQHDSIKVKAKSNFSVPNPFGVICVGDVGFECSSDTFEEEYEKIHCAYRFNFSMTKAVLEEENNEFLEDFYKALPGDPKKGDKKLWINRQLEKNPDCFVHEMYRFISEIKVTHYVSSIFWGHFVKRDHHYTSTRKDVGAHGNISVDNIGGGFEVNKEHTQESHNTTKKGTDQGVVSHSISSIDTLISEKYLATRKALFQAIQNYMSTMETFSKSQNARKIKCRHMGAKRSDENFLKVNDHGLLIKTDGEEEASSFYISNWSCGIIIAHLKHPKDSPMFVNYEGSDLQVNIDDAKVYVLENPNPMTKVNYSDDVWKDNFLCIKVASKFKLKPKSQYFGWNSKNEVFSLRSKKNRAEFKLCSSEDVPDLGQLLCKKQAFLSQKSILISFVKTLQEDVDEGNKAYVDGLIKDKIKKFIIRESKGSKKEDIEECLRSLYDDLTLDSDLWKWSLDEVAAAFRETSVVDVCDVAAEVSEESDCSDVSDDKDEPMLSTSTVYHATLCSYVIVTKKHKDCFNHFNHQFDELSFSDDVNSDKTTDFLIARKKDTYYIAFHSNTAYHSEDIIEQADSFPLRFLIKQLHGGSKVVCTGFGWGGLIAQCVVRKLWKQGYIDIDILQESLCCITLSVPLTSMSYSYNILRDNSEETRATFHCLIARDDGSACLQLLLDNAFFRRGRYEDMEMMDMIFRNWQGDMHHSQILQEMIHNFLQRSRDSLYFNGQCCVYSIENSSEEELRWAEMTNCDEIATMCETSFNIETHNMTQEQVIQLYYEKILKIYEKSCFNGMSSLLPNVVVAMPVINLVSVHQYKEEFDVTVSGDHMWFSFKVQVGSLTSSKFDSSQKSLKFNVPDIDQSLVETKSTSVKVWSFFSEPVTFANIEVEHEAYTFSFRQEQLAKLTPSELIETSYLIALLEQFPHDTNTNRCYSKRFEAIRTFLTRVVHVVPVESLVHAMCNAKKFDIAIQCCHQLMSCSDRMQPSLTSVSCFKKALRRVDNDIFSGHASSAQRSKLLQAHQQNSSLHRPQGRYQGYEKEIKFLEYNSAPRTSWILRDLEAINGSNLSDTNLLSDSGPIYSPLSILQKGRKKMRELCVESDQPEGSQYRNNQMLELVNDIKSNEVEVCSLLLGSFMEEQIRVPLNRTPSSTVRAISATVASAALGVWALFSSSLGDVQALFSSNAPGSLLVEVADFIRGYFQQDMVVAGEMYAGKLQFMLQSMHNEKRSVSCSAHYVSYSLEHQLIELCKSLKIDDNTSLDTLVTNWDEIFKDNTMSLVVQTHRSLIARWFKWAFMVHNLREELARCTAVGVIGLVNSGKSSLVSNLFKIKIPAGTTARDKTTVPLLYNMDGMVDGLDVIDFPGVDDRDETISRLAELLLSIAQVVIFVVEYKRAHTTSAEKWLKLLHKKSVPVLVCLTHGDRLFVELMDKGESGISERVKVEKKKILEQLGGLPFHDTELFYFHLNADSYLKSDDWQEKIKASGIKTYHYVGDWLAETLEKHLDQDALAERLKEFFDTVER